MIPPGAIPMTYVIVTPQFLKAVFLLREKEINPDLPEIKILVNISHGTFKGYRGALHLMDNTPGLTTHTREDCFYAVKTKRFRWFTEEDWHYLKGVTALGL